MRGLLAGLLLALLPARSSAPAQPLAAAAWRARAGDRPPPSPAEGSGAPGPPREPRGRTAAGVRRCARGALRGWRVSPLSRADPWARGGWWRAEERP